LAQKVNRSRREILKKAVKGALLLPYVVPAIETILVQPILMQDLYGQGPPKKKKKCSPGFIWLDIGGVAKCYPKKI
jgi:hypothetical protein